jgi:hypothetical protein
MRKAVAVVVLLAVAEAAVAQATSGVYFYGHEAESFYPCGSNKAYWVIGRQDVLRELRSKADQLRTSEQPYPPLFVQAVGREASKDTTSGDLAEQYDAIFRVSRVKRFSELVPASCKNKGLTPHSSGSPTATADFKR